jgi:hypothetical protein
MTIILKKKSLINGKYFCYYNNNTYVRLLSIIIELLFVVLNYFTLHYLRLFMAILKFLAILNYFTLGYFRLFYIAFGYFILLLAI